MKLRFLLFVLTLALNPGLATGADDAGDESAPLPKVVLLGDSIRMNYQAAVQAELKGKAAVRSPKDNCKHTVFVLENLERWLKEAGPDLQLIHLNVGLHDMYLDGKSGKPRHTLETYEKNLRAIFAKLDELSDATVVFALTTAVDEEDQANSKGYGRVVRRNSDIQIYNTKAREVAEELGITVNDLYTFMEKTGSEKILRPSDGIHLSPQGCELVGAKVAEVILEALSQ